MPGVWFLWSKKKNIIIIFQKENGNTFTLLIIIIVKSLQKEQIAQITYYDPWSAGISVQWPLSNSTPQVTNSSPHIVSAETILFWISKL